MIRTLIVVDVPFYRSGLAEVLQRSGEICVVAAAENAATAESLARAHAPDLVLVDVDMSDAAEAIRRIRTLPAPPKFVALAVRETPDAVLRWIEVGASAYVPRSATVDELLEVLRDVAHDEFSCPPRMAAHILHHVAVLASASRREGDATASLSPREHEVLSLLARGLPNKTIATTLRISPATAKNHVHNILEKLRLHRRSEVASLMREASRRESA